MSVRGNQSELRPNLRETQAHVCQKSQGLSLRVSCGAARRCSCKTNRFCSCLMPGCAILVERTSLILFHCSAEACRVSTQLRGAGCSRKFSADSNKACPWRRTRERIRTLPLKPHYHCSIRSFGLGEPA